MTILDIVALAHAIMLVVGVCISSRIVSHMSFLVHARKDPARTTFRYLKFAFATFSAYALFFIVFAGVGTAQFYMYKNSDSIRDSPYYNLYKAFGSCSKIGELMTVICELSIDTLIAFILPRLFTATLNAYTGSSELTGKIIGVAFRVVIFVLVALNFVILALELLNIFSMFFAPDDVPISFVLSFVLLEIRFAFKHVIIVTSLAVAAGSVVVKTQTGADKSFAWASTMLVTASVVWLLHACMVSGWIQFADDLYVYSFQFTFGIWLQFVILIMVYTMLDKANGVWSGQQEPLTQAKKAK
ncbi:hypothetical protein FSPOR_11050 [Fusarium sporotrichioides]|uniref:Transmembrane protein n=1 Tax=Fusarium sporotrichioides TaxID=5514 RepID=A0A395RJ22_FUSSP|nr:hypothetical protein FSPOR_11050 [Fusarium sporotrichioides]